MFTFSIKSEPLTTDKSALFIIHFEINAPFCPCFLTTPSVVLTSCATNSVNVPSPLSKAPVPSATPVNL